ncbi:carbonic anhydrase 2-like [Uranotaenia lowii]|uniref:carbonic anhydrase 2-like n=1 Tax=Uranotaenia lowii TaxID=190385 RepID=UPI002478FFBE|nr:carbonic anhydrase 2-like [Uranotaenia lowii]
MFFLVLQLLGVFVIPILGDGVYFSYGVGVEDWGLISKYCDGLKQSPIALESWDTEDGPINKPPLQILNWEVNPTRVVVKNTGQTVAFFMTYPANRQLLLRGGPLNGSFAFAGLHFHWGSEHVDDEKRYPIEMHIVFYNRWYTSFEEAQYQPNGLAAVGFFFEPNRNARTMRWVDSLKSITRWGATYQFQNPYLMNLKAMIGQFKPYFAYSGSLTTPPCYETVTWIIQRDPLIMTPVQMNLFQSLRSKTGYLRSNYRPLQDVNDRIVYLKAKREQMRNKRNFTKIIWSYTNFATVAEFFLTLMEIITLCHENQTGSDHEE